MLFEEHQHEKKADEVFEVTIASETRQQKSTNKSTELRVSQEEFQKKLETFKQCCNMYTHLKDSMIRRDDVCIQLPDQLQAKYIIKSITYLSDEWITLKTSFIRHGESQHHLIIDLDHIEENQIANMCSELNECIDHFIARAT